MIKRTPVFFIGLSLVSFLAFSSCNSSAKKDGAKTEEEAKDEPKMEDAQLVNINGDYSMMIPKHLKTTTELNDQASLQYQDIYKELYIIVIDESKEEFIKTFKDLDEYDDKKSAERNYREVQMKTMAEKLTIETTPEVKKANIGGLESEIVDFIGMSEGIAEKIYYKFAFIDGKDNMYMVMAWTLASNKDKNSEEMDAMLNSFKLQEAAKK